MLRLNPRILLSLVVAVALSAVMTTRCHDGRVSHWEERARMALAEAGRQQARADTLQMEADSLRSQAEDLAAAVRTRAPVTDTLILELPPAETPGELQRDSVIARLTVERDDALEAFDRQAEAAAKLQEAFDRVSESRDSLVAVLEDRPSERPWYIPRLGVGPGVGSKGFDVQLHLSWEIKF